MIRSVPLQSFGAPTRSATYPDPHFQPFVHGQRAVAEVSARSLALQLLNLSAASRLVWPRTRLRRRRPSGPSPKLIQPRQEPSFPLQIDDRLLAALVTPPPAGPGRLPQTGAGTQRALPMQTPPDPPRPAAGRSASVTPAAPGPPQPRSRASLRATGFPEPQPARRWSAGARPARTIEQPPPGVIERGPCRDPEPPPAPCRLWSYLWLAVLAAAPTAVLVCGRGRDQQPAEGSGQVQWRPRT